MDLASTIVAALSLSSGMGGLVKSFVTDTPARAKRHAESMLRDLEDSVLEKVAERLRNAIDLHQATCRVRPGSSSAAFASLSYASKDEVGNLRSELAQLRDQMRNVEGDVRTADRNVARLVGLLEGEARAEDRHSRHGHEDD